MYATESILLNEVENLTFIPETALPEASLTSAVIMHLSTPFASGFSGLAVIPTEYVDFVKLTRTVSRSVLPYLPMT